MRCRQKLRAFDDLPPMKILHAADLHLDSPLHGLAQYDGAPVSELRGATRRALASLVDLALAEEVALVVIAGDVYDGDWKDHNTGLYFVAQMSRLRQADIPVVLISGNHDAASVITKRLRLPDNTTLLSDRRAETRVFQSLGVAVHGRSFSNRSVTEDLSATYPAPHPDFFNLAILHTSADGRPGHDSYAPCRLEALVDTGHQYWALGHIHQREVLHTDPWVIFPGNVQGRHARETGPKGATLITLDGDRVEDIEHRDLDSVRWDRCVVDVTGAQDADDVLTRVAPGIEAAAKAAGPRTVAARIVLRGICGVHARLSADREQLVNDIRAVATDRGDGAVWVERVKVETTPEHDVERLRRGDDPLGELLRSIQDARSDDAELVRLGHVLRNLAAKLPAEMTRGSDSVDFDDPQYVATLLPRVEDLLLTRLTEAGAR